MAESDTTACRECETDLGAGYLCDECDSLTVEPTLRHHTVGDLRREICDMVGIETDRYGTRSQRSFTKPHLCAIADALAVTHEDMTLAELYPALCDAVGIEYNENAGNQWKLGRPQLKALYRALAL